MLKKIVLLGILLLACQSYAQVVDPDDDGIGIYFDPAAMNNCISSNVGEQVAWLIITHPTSVDGVGSWEAKIWIEGPAFTTDWILFGNGIDFAAMPKVELLGFACPLLDVSGNYQGMGGSTGADRTVLGTLLVRSAGSVFVKMVGPSEEMKEHRDAFVAFVESLEEVR